MTTEYVLREALSIVEEQGYDTTFWGVRGKQIGFCTHCDQCLSRGGCVINDDMQTLYPLLREAKALIVTTPVYNGGVSAQIKAVMDRTRGLLAQDPKVFRGKPGVAIAVGGDRAGGQELALQQILAYYTLNGAIPISGGFFGANLGASMWSKDTMDGIVNDTEGMKNLRRTVNSLLKHLGEEGT